MKYMVPANDGTVIECSTAIGGCLGVLSDRIRVAEAERRFSARKVKKRNRCLPPGRLTISVRNSVGELIDLRSQSATSSFKSNEYSHEVDNWSRSATSYNVDAEEKRAVGAVWSSRSEGPCLFECRPMVTSRGS